MALGMAAGWRHPPSGKSTALLLDCAGRGGTNLNKAPEMGIEKLSKNVAHEKVAILVTDG